MPASPCRHATILWSVEQIGEKFHNTVVNFPALYHTPQIAKFVKRPPFHSKNLLFHRIPARIRHKYGQRCRAESLYRIEFYAYRVRLVGRLGYGQKKSRINRCGLPCYPHENTHN